MQVSIIGTGRMGSGLIKILSPYVHDVLWASRDQERIKTLILEYNLQQITPVSYDQALDADIIIHSMWFRELMPWAKENKEHLAGKILVDIANPFTEDFSEFTLDWGQSAAEELQKILPDTKIVGAFKNTFFQVFEEPIHDGLKSDIYITSDDEHAKKVVMELLCSIPFRVLDGGELKNNRIIERLTLFEREMAIRYDSYPYVSNRLFGIKVSG